MTTRALANVTLLMYHKWALNYRYTFDLEAVKSSVMINWDQSRDEPINAS